MSINFWQFMFRRMPEICHFILGLKLAKTKTMYDIGVRGKVPELTRWKLPVSYLLTHDKRWYIGRVYLRFLTAEGLQVFVSVSNFLNSWSWAMSIDFLTSTWDWKIPIRERSPDIFAWGKRLPPQQVSSATFQMLRLSHSLYFFLIRLIRFSHDVENADSISLRVGRWASHPTWKSALRLKLHSIAQGNGLANCNGELVS